MSDDTDEYSDTTRQVLADLDPGTAIGDKIILSQAQVAAVIGGVVTLGGVLGVGAGRASAQSEVGKLGSESEPIDADLGNYGSTSTASGYEFTIEGDTFQVNE